MTPQSATTNVEQIAAAIQSNLRGEATPGFPLPPPYARVSEVELWIDKWQRSAGIDRQRIEDAVEFAAVNALHSDDLELIAGTLRLLRRIRPGKVAMRPVNPRTRDALVVAANAGRFKETETSYGDLHAELLACIGNLRIKADDLSFWVVQMNDPHYVASAVSGCLDSGSSEIARQGVSRAVKKQDPTLPFSLNRLFQLHYPDEDKAWNWFISMRRTGFWTEEDWQRMAEAARVFDWLAPDPDQAPVAIPQRGTDSARPAVVRSSVLESRVLLRRRLKTAGFDFEEEYEIQGDFEIRQAFSALGVAPHDDIQELLRRLAPQRAIPTLKPGESSLRTPLEEQDLKSKPKSPLPSERERSSESGGPYPFKNYGG